MREGMCPWKKDNAGIENSDDFPAATSLRKAKLNRIPQILVNLLLFICNSGRSQARSQ